METENQAHTSSAPSSCTMSVVLVVHDDDDALNE